jgi:hypothetical protein
MSVRLLWQLWTLRQKESRGCLPPQLQRKLDVSIMSDHQPEAPKIVDSTKVFIGRVFSVTVDTVQEGNVIYQREVVHHPGSAVIIPVFADDTVALVKQYRHPAVRYLLEAPAGTLNDRESPDVGAARELEEELG